MIDERPEPVWRSNPPSVAAILVSHDGAAWLPKVLASLSGLTHAPTTWHAVDVSSTDGSAELLRRSFGAERITYAPSGTGFGDAVRLALTELPRTDWIWLLHDDVTVAPGALAGLLDEATLDDDVAVVGPKIREWPSLRRLLEVGLTITNTASRETGLETGEPDAGQHDWPEDVLAVNTAGMLVRRDVWDELGGLDPELPLYSDDIDFGWRVNRAGYRVRTAPGAMVFHAEASSRRLRQRSAGDVSHHEQRRAQVFTVLANTSTRRFWWQYLRLFFGSLLRFIGQVIGRDPDGAGDELLALRSVYLHPGRLRRARQSRAATAKVSHGDIAHLFPSWWLPYQHSWDILVEAVRAAVRPETVETVGRRTYVIDEGDDGEAGIEVESGPSLWRRRPWLSASLLFIVVALVAGRGLISGGLNGGALLPTPDSAGGWWSLVVGGASDVALPSMAFAPPYVVILALAATPIWFGPGLVVWILMILGPVLAALTAHRLGRQISDYRPARIMCAISYGVVVAACGVIDQGRIGTVVGLIVAPIIVNVTVQFWASPHWQTGLRLGIWIAVGSAFAPVLLPMSVVGLVMVLVARRRTGDLRRFAVNAGITLVVALVLLGPWLLQRSLNPWRVWWDAGSAFSAQPDLMRNLLGADGSSSWWWAGIPVVVLGVVALLPRDTRGGVLWAWAIGLIGLLAAGVGYVVTYETPAGAAGIVPTLALPAGVFLGALLAAALVASRDLHFLPRQFAAGFAIVALVFPIVAGAHWVARGTGDPLSDDDHDLVPAYLAERAGSTLVIHGDLEQGVSYVLAPGESEYLGEEAMIRASQTTDDLQVAVDRLLSSPSEQVVQTLLDAGVSAVYLPNADLDLAARVDAAPSMHPAGSESPASRVWTIDGDLGDVTPDRPWWRPVLGLIQAAAWILAIVLTAPVSRRDERPSYADEIEEAEEEVIA